MSELPILDIDRPKPKPDRPRVWLVDLFGLIGLSGVVVSLGAYDWRWGCFAGGILLLAAFVRGGQRL